MADTCTYLRNNGESQIDYILTRDPDPQLQVSVLADHTLDLSPHLPVRSVLDVPLQETCSKPARATPALQPRPRWDNCDLEKYKCELQEKLPDLLEAPTALDVERQVLLVTTAISEASAASLPPARKVKRKHTRPWSLEIAEAVANSKQSLHRWREAGCPKGPHPLYRDREDAKKALRSALRRQDHHNRIRFFTRITDASSSDQKLFHQLIRRQRKSKTDQSLTLKHNGKLVSDQEELLTLWMAHFEHLGTPLENPEFDDDHLDLMRSDVSVIEQRCVLDTTPPAPVTAKEVLSALNRLNNGKAADEHGLISEHLKSARSVLLPHLVNLLNAIFTTRHVPDSFKTGIIIPVLKKRKDPLSTDSYRGITITPLLGKVLEHIILERKYAPAPQHQLQYGFTPGRSPTMAALLCTEATAEAIDCRIPLYIAALDTKKAFDTVDHTLLKRKIYDVNNDSTLWLLESQLMDGLSAKVRVNNQMTESFSIHQGVGQGRVLSPSQYKAYIDTTLTDLDTLLLGATIGSISIGMPTCADDLLLLSNSYPAAQGMFHAAKGNANRDRSIIHPQKTLMVACNHPPSDPDIWELGDNEITISDSLTHLGLTRTGALSPDEAVNDHIAGARATLYSLMGAGLHGRNGLTPVVTRAMYRTYVLPRLIYGLEALKLTQQQIDKLERYHRRTLRVLQSLPDRVANSAVYLLFGTPPLEATLDIHIANLLGRIANQRGSVLYDVMERQLAVKGPRSRSWFIYASRRLAKYKDLPSLHDLLQHPVDLTCWKVSVKQIILDHWTTVLQEDAACKSSLRLLQSKTCTLTDPHPVWKHSTDHPRHAVRAIVKARLLTGGYTLQANRHRFNQYEVSATCPVCSEGAETRLHLIRQCRAYAPARKIVDDQLAQLIHGYKDMTDEDKLQAILDPDCVSDRARYELSTASYLYALHVHRTKELRSHTST